MIERHDDNPEALLVTADITEYRLNRKRRPTTEEWLRELSPVGFYHRGDRATWYTAERQAAVDNCNKLRASLETYPGKATINPGPGNFQRENDISSGELILS
ncbi:hypothetical protein HZH68_002592 [Vespula germanica]|uniref:Uncharacterized protein n=2 Tax=Vespula TaxID=7451 RepID=A0A834U1I5_VESGE|nr:hypothetical protein HZH66_002501 [Vespula vulgaris]KAF7414103.1 hypothetical protein HZH68_002592 [Vespula germanica]